MRLFIFIRNLARTTWKSDNYPNKNRKKRAIGTMTEAERY